MVASLATVILWTAKAVAIAIVGGLGRSPFEGPLFFLGFASALVAAAAIGVAATAGQRRLLRILAAAAGIISAVVVTLLVGGVVAVVEPARPGWAWGEVNLWVLGLAAVCVATLLRQQSPGRAR